MARVELPQSRLRARRRHKRRLFAFIAAGIVLALFGVVVGITYLPFLQVREVAVSGTETLSTSSVQAYVQHEISGRYAYLFPKRNIFLYPKQHISRALLSEFPELRSADVRAENFHTLGVSIVEREQKALWCQNQDCYRIDQDGVVYARAEGDDGLVAYHGKAEGSGLPRQYLEPGQFEELFALVDALSQKSGTILAVTVDELGDVRAEFEGGFELRFSLDDAGGDVFDRFTLALTAEPFAGKTLSDFYYLDLRFGDKLYYKQK